MKAAEKGQQGPGKHLVWKTEVKVTKFTMTTFVQCFFAYFINLTRSQWHCKPLMSYFEEEKTVYSRTNDSPLASSQHHEIFPNIPKIQKVRVTNVLIAM